MDKHSIELKFYNLLMRNLNIQEFEKWVYETDEELVDEHFGRGFYFELASLNYKNKYAINDVEKLLFSKVPFGRFEEMKIREILTYVIDDKGDLVELIEELYDLYCDGYYFLRYIGLASLFHGMPRENETYNFTDQTQINLKCEARRILSFLDTRKIIITGKYKYEDLREEADKIELHSLEKMYVTPKRILLTEL
ncbi:hypothetical protein T472_0206690 [Youngiibacter fragilis 232.1]|uniref:Uncharacterized protein n=2 Tax=Youngiibacter TaxID=1408818 RepID=V7I8P8_9CLOT|nr:hypothetical protein T472_0206690 [Youngiibacter fragilis 232.1]